MKWGFLRFMEKREMKTRMPKGVYTAQFRDAAVRQASEVGRTATEVARSLEILSKTLGNWVRKVRRGDPLVKRATVLQVDDAQAELSRLRAENARPGQVRKPAADARLAQDGFCGQSQARAPADAA